MPRLVLLLAVMLAAAPAWGASYKAQLDPVPFDASNRADVIGSIGNVAATLNGDTLTVSGKFSNMTSPATGASIRLGLAKGVSGDAIATLTATPRSNGSVSGSVKLTAAQMTALKKQALYVRVNSQKAPDGNLQGWLEEAEGN